ncbi:MAG TPA: hypothetical protein VMT58_02120 [Candidatus Binataceae bacterium]|nr:hypothetical protein [Candidatus Binataceae bacterium]
MPRAGWREVAIPTPTDLADQELTIPIDHSGFNRRTIRANGTPLGWDIRKILCCN